MKKKSVRALAKRIPVVSVCKTRAKVPILKKEMIRNRQKVKENKGVKDFSTE
jgi:hypothetical protein